MSNTTDDTALYNQQLMKGFIGELGPWLCSNHIENTIMDEYEAIVVKGSVPAITLFKLTEWLRRQLVLYSVDSMTPVYPNAIDISLRTLPHGVTYKDVNQYILEAYTQENYLTDEQRRDCVLRVLEHHFKGKSIQEIDIDEDGLTVDLMLSETESENFRLPLEVDVEVFPSIVPAINSDVNFSVKSTGEGMVAIQIYLVSTDEKLLEEISTLLKDIST